MSIVVPTYNVAAFLPDFLAALAAQTLPLDRIEMIFVNDGSTDGSEQLIRRWTAQHAPHATIISKPNGGLASARNAGMAVATAPWVNFCDPDDAFNRSYFKTVDDFLASPDAARAQLVATRLMILDDATGRLSDGHPLAFKFGYGRRLVDLTRTPDWIHLQAASAFLRRDAIEAQGLLFDDDIRPNFEDSYLITLYLAAFDRPTIAVLPKAEYHYRHRADGSSLVQASWTNPLKYTHLPRVGYLRLLQTIHARLGAVPEWVQNLVLYDLFFYFRMDGRENNSPTAGLPAEVTDAFHDLLAQIGGFIDADVIERYDVSRTVPEFKQALILGAKRVRDRSDRVYRDRIDRDQRLTRLRYFFTGNLPAERFAVGGSDVLPVHAKVRSVDFFGRTMVYERIAWLPGTETVTVSLDGPDVPVVAARDWTPPTLADDSGPITAKLHRAARIARRARDRMREDPDLVRQRAEDFAITALARTPQAKRTWRDAWLLIDRDSGAQDNAEHLYRYLRANHPELNTWFVLARSSSDWPRLDREGFRLLEYGSRDYYVAITHCEHLISSQIDHYVAAPTAGRRLRKGGWRLSFLQHGVTKDDLSRWINLKPLDLMITVTPDEQASIAGDYTPYVFTTREVELTGFPRHDRLLELGRQHDAERNLLLVMPTWRRELLGASTAGGNDRDLVPGFWQSEYAVQWRAFLESERLHEVAERAGWQIAFVPHPNMQDYLDSSPLPAHVQVHRFRDIDVQDVLARGALLVTDYSSMAFEAAYLRRPVVYFQFDQADFFAGAHAYRRGSWSYVDNGFGPVTFGGEEAVDAVAAIAEHGADAEYATRMEKTFPLRDGQCCRRTAEAVLALRKPAVHGAER